MALTKKEAAEREALERALREARAFHNLSTVAPPPVGPDTSLPLMSVQRGIWWMNPYRMENTTNPCFAVGPGIRRGTSSHIYSDTGNSWAHGPGQFWGSRRDALLALRADQVRKFATILGKIDAALEEEAANG